MFKSGAWKTTHALLRGRKLPNMKFLNDGDTMGRPKIYGGKRGRVTRVFMTGKNEQDVLERAREKYVGFDVVDVKLDPKKKPTRNALAMGYTGYYRVYLRKLGGR